jgi:hypothetical protein
VTSLSLAFYLAGIGLIVGAVGAVLLVFELERSFPQ